MLEPDNTDTPTDTTTAAEAAAPAKAPRKRVATKAAPATDAAGEIAAKATAPRKRAAKKAAPAEAVAADAVAPAEESQPADATPRKRAPRKAAAKKAQPAEDSAVAEASAATATPVKAPRKRAAKKVAADTSDTDTTDTTGIAGAEPVLAAPAGAQSVLFVAPDETRAEKAPAKRARRVAKAPAGPPTSEAPSEAPSEALEEPVPGEAELAVAEDAEDRTAEPEDVREAAVEEATGARRRRRRGRRGRGSRSAGEGADHGGEHDGDDGDDGEHGEHAAADDEHADQDGADLDAGADAGEGGATRRRRRRRRAGGSGDGGDGGREDSEDPPNTVTHVRETREGKKKDNGDDGVRGVKGSTRLEAKRQRRREGRDTGRRRPPILTESEFLARREAVDRVMAVRQRGDRTQIAVLEDGVLVEHYVTRASATSYVGNVYLGRVQNVLPSMEAAFVDIGKGRNGVLYAGEVNWDAAGLEGKSRAIENALSSGDTVLVQVTKDPIGHKGARLTSQVSLPGRFLVYVPGGGMTGISRKLPDTERHRLKAILKKIVPEDAGVIIRTAAEGASEEELTRDVDRLKAQWETIAKQAENTKSAPTLVHGEPDLAIRVVRDVFNEDFKKLVVEGEQAWTTVSDYLNGVAPDLAERASRHTADTDLFHDLRVDEQLMKALDRKVWLPSGGSLVIDRTEAMTVIDVNTGKFVGTGGNLEQTVTRNNLEAAEEIVRQLRLRDVGGIVVIDFIDMVLESNRELVLRRLTECLGRDRTKHQVAEVTSLGLVQMTRKRVGEGLLEAFSEPCEHCKGRGVLIHSEPVDKSGAARADADDAGGDRPKAKRKRGAAKKAEPAEPAEDPETRERRLSAMAAIHKASHHEGDAPAELELEAVAAVLDAEPQDLDAYLTDTGVTLEPQVEVESGQADASEPAGATDEPAPEAAPERPARPRRRRAASRPAGPPAPVTVDSAGAAGADAG